MPSIQESNQKMTPDFIASMKTQSLTQRNDKSNWTSGKTALASGIISSLGLAYFTYKHYGQKDIVAPLNPLSNPIGTAIKVLLPVSVVISSLYYCFKNNNCQRFDNDTSRLTNHPKNPQRSPFTTPSYQNQSNKNLNHPIYTPPSQNQYSNVFEVFNYKKREEDSSQGSQGQHFGTGYLEFPINIIPSSQIQSSSHNSFSSLSDLENFSTETCENFKNNKEITEDTVEAIKTVLIYLENNAVFPTREIMLGQLLILVMTLMNVEKDYGMAAIILSHVYDKFLEIDENRAVDIATYCLYVEKSNDESKNNDLIYACEKIVERTKNREKLFISLAVKCSERERAESSPSHDNIVIEFLKKYKEVGEVIINYMIGCSKLDSSYAQEKIKSLHMNEGISIPLLNSCIDNLFGNNKSQPLVGNKAVIFDFFERRIHQIVCNESLLPEIQKIIKSCKTAYKINEDEINEDELFIKKLINIIENDGTEESKDAYSLLKIVFECYQLSDDCEKLQMLLKNCHGHFILDNLTFGIKSVLKSFINKRNTDQSAQKFLTT